MNRKEVQEIFDRTAKLSGVVGAQLSIIKGDEHWDFVHGVANADLAIAMTSDTSIQVGSTTKLFNAMIVLSLVEEGKLDLDVPIKKYIPEFEVANPDATCRITLRHLLSMSSGIDNGDYSDYGIGEDALAKRVAALRRLPQHSEPGSHFGYSNASADIAGYVAERVTGVIWDELLRRRILEPAELWTAASLDRERVFHRVSVGHVAGSEGGPATVIRPWGITRGLAPAGSTLTISSRDLVRFGQLFIMKGVADSGVRVVSEASIECMMAPQIPVPVHYHATSWCLGPCIETWNNTHVWGHRGGNFSGSSFLYWSPEIDGVIACITNTPSSFPRFAKVVSQELMTAVFDVGKPEITVPEVVEAIDLTRYTGVYESLAGKCLVDIVKNDLILTTRWSAVMTKLEDTATLLPLGGDRFLINKHTRVDLDDLPEDIAFFGDDGHGRASNMVRLIQCSRKK
jgi:CubicO group peptidase (beta-lactamase class C family)